MPWENYKQLSSLVVTVCIKPVECSSVAVSSAQPCLATAVFIATRLPPPSLFLAQSVVMSRNSCVGHRWLLVGLPERHAACYCRFLFAHRLFVVWVDVMRHRGVEIAVCTRHIPRYLNFSENCIIIILSNTNVNENYTWSFGLVGFNVCGATVVQLELNLLDTFIPLYSNSFQVIRIQIEFEYSGMNSNTLEWKQSLQLHHCWNGTSSWIEYDLWCKVMRIWYDEL